MHKTIAKLIDTRDSDASLRAAANLVLERAKWASQTFLRYDRRHSQAIAEAVARVAHDKAGTYGDWAVKETGFGVAAHKKLKNELSSLPLVEHYRDWNFVDPVLDRDNGLVKIPRPAGVVFALVPSTNPIATIYFKVLSCLMTRNAIVLSPHPAARECCVDAVKALAQAAEAAGAPEAIIQVIERPTIPLIEQFMRSEKTDVILATGGTAMVRAAYSSANPAIGVGPGNAPVYVDASADLKQAAARIVESKSFDNSVLCTNESVLITTDEVMPGLGKHLRQAGAYLCSEEESHELRRYLFHERGFNVEALGQSAAWIADKAGIKVNPKTKILVTPIDKIGVEEPLSREKLCPVLGLFTAKSRPQAIAQARALLRLAGAGHSAAIHATDQAAIMAFASQVEVYRVVVNAPCSQGAAGFASGLPPTFTIGTGFFGRSSIGENVGPQHLVHWTQVAWGDGTAKESDGGPPASLMGTALDHPGPLPEAPSDGVPGSPKPTPARGVGQGAGEVSLSDGDYDAVREEIRRIVIEELRSVLKD